MFEEKTDAAHRREEMPSDAAGATKGARPEWGGLMKVCAEFPGEQAILRRQGVPARVSFCFRFGVFPENYRKAGLVRRVAPKLHIYSADSGA